jgi:opacity protein-like surface antigen
MKKLKFAAIVLLALSSAPALAQVNAQYNGQYSGQYRGQFNGQYSGQYYGGGAANAVTPYGRLRYQNPLGIPVENGACGELYFPAPGTDYIAHDRQGRRCY